MNINKEYIKECENEIIQGLRIYESGYIDVPNRLHLKEGDRYCYKPDYRKNNIETRIEQITCTANKDRFFWLPTGDQLDDEIIKICKKRFESPWYELRHSSIGCDVVIEYYKEGKPIRIFKRHSNPLMAKILLLKKLLEEK